VASTRGLVIATTQGDVVAWLCFALGAIFLLGGATIGLWASRRRTPRKAREARAKLEEARARIDEAQGHIDETTRAVTDSNLESVASSSAQASTAAQAAGASADAAKSAVEEVQGIVAALPENLRFAGLLILVGTVLIGVATVQFGGVSLF
jgi:hypothetical protein